MYDKVLAWIAQGQSKAYISKQLNMHPNTLDNWLKKNGIEYSGNRGGKGIKTDPKRKSAIEYMQKEYGVKSHALKLKMLEDGLKDHKCECCKNTLWNSKPIPLELHHKDGNHFNNAIDNLELLCPNCHAQCDNNSGKARKKK